MAFKRHTEADMEALVRELKEEQPLEPTEGTCLLDSIENWAVKIGDAVTRRLTEETINAKVATREEARCPSCGEIGQWKGDRVRQLEGRRGKVEVKEPQYYCPGCRRAFFPDDPSAGH